MSRFAVFLSAVMMLSWLFAAAPPDPCNPKISTTGVGDDAAYQQRRAAKDGDPYCEGRFNEPVSGLPDFAIVEYSFGSLPALSTLGDAWYIFWPHTQGPVLIHGEPRNALDKYALDGAESTPDPDDASTQTDWFKWETSIVKAQIGEKADIALSVFALDQIAVDDPDSTRHLMLPTQITTDARPEALAKGMTRATLELRSTASVHIHHIELRPFPSGSHGSRVYVPKFRKRSISRAMTYSLDLEFGEGKLPLDGSTWQLILHHSTRPDEDAETTASEPLYLVMPPESFVREVDQDD